MPRSPRPTPQQTRLNEQPAPGAPSLTGDEQTVFGHVRERREARARALFYARLALMSIGLGVLLVPAWHQALNISLPFGVYWYLFILAYQVASYLWVGRRGARVVLFFTLCLDLLAVLYLVAASGGLKSPLLPAQLVFTMLFALLFPSPLYLLPPLLILPVVAKVDQILGTQTLPGDLLVVLWYSALNITVVYVMVYLEGREQESFREVVRLQGQRRLADLERERTRMAREIHDSVGTALSGVMLQAEYLVSRIQEADLRREMEELRTAVGEGMGELRRAVALLRKDLQLSSSVADYLESFGQRQHLAVRFEMTGQEPEEMDPELLLSVFRVLQEALANAARHAGASCVQVSLDFDEAELHLRVRDDGKGFDPTRVGPGHYGLRNMQERAERAGGVFAMASDPGAGTTLDLRVPLFPRT